MREVLFRGKRVDNGEWAFGFLYITHNGEYEISNYDDELNVERKTAIVNSKTIGQYTGLTDKNGIAIFEGDIVDILTENEELGVVEYKEGGFIVQADGFWVEFLHNIGGTEVEVVGNIYDNGELVSDWY